MIVCVCVCERERERERVCERERENLMLDVIGKTKKQQWKQNHELSLFSWKDNLETFRDGNKSFFTSMINSGRFLKSQIRKKKASPN